LEILVLSALECFQLLERQYIALVKVLHAQLHLLLVAVQEVLQHFEIQLTFVEDNQMILHFFGVSGPL